MPNSSSSSEEFSDWAYRLEDGHKELSSFLGVELGYHTPAPGNVHRRIDEAQALAKAAYDLLRGKESEMGLIGRVEVLTKTWNVLLCAITALGGYIVRMLTE